MRPLRLALVMALTACASAPAAGTGAANDPSRAADVAITHASVLDIEGGRWLGDHTVLIRNGMVVSVEPSVTTEAPRAAVTIDASGRYLMPGMFDMHVHLEHFPGPELLALFPAYGVTAVRNMDGRPHILDWKRRVSDGSLIGPRIFSAGPLLDGDPPIRDDNTIVRSTAEARAAVMAQADSGYDFIKVYTNISAESYASVITAAMDRGLPVVGHFPRFATVDAVLVGHRSLEHATEYARLVEADDSPARNRFHWSKLYLAMPMDSARMKDIAGRAAAAGLFTTPTLVQSERALGPADSVEAWLAAPEIAYIPADARTFWRRSVAGTSGRLDADDWAVVARGRANRLSAVRALHAAGAGLLIGTDTPNPFVVPGHSLHTELQLMVEAGLSPALALRAATLDAARFLGADSLGTIEPGKRADLILLDENPLADIRNTRSISEVLLAGIRVKPDSLLVPLARSARAP